MFFFQIIKEHQLKIDWHQLKSLLKLIILSSPVLIPRKCRVIEYAQIVWGAGPTPISIQHYRRTAMVKPGKARTCCNHVMFTNKLLSGLTAS